MERVYVNTLLRVARNVVMGGYTVTAGAKTQMILRAWGAAVLRPRTGVRVVSVSAGLHLNPAI
jgi:hypothetical protein